MSYNTNIPQGTDTTLQSQKQLLANFQTIAKLFGTNHFNLEGDPNFQGMHTVLTMQAQTGDPATNATQIALYNKLVPLTTGIPELFFMPNNAQTPIQLTYPSINTTIANMQQYTFVAGPFVVYAGKVINPTNGQQVTLSPTTNILYAGLTLANFGTGQVSFSRTPTATSINSPASSFSITYEVHTLAPTPNQVIYYLAIGQ